MKYLKYFSLIVLAFSLTLFDTSFFSFLDIFGSNILSSFIFLLSLALLIKYQDLLIFVFSISLFFAAFSSLPVWQIFISFFILPEITFFVKKKYLPDISVLPVAITFVITAVLFGAVLIMGVDDFSSEAFGQLGYFALINAVLGISVYEVLKYSIGRLRPNEIKIQN